MNQIIRVIGKAQKQDNRVLKKKGTISELINRFSEPEAALEVKKNEQNRSDEEQI